MLLNYYYRQKQNHFHLDVFARKVPEKSEKLNVFPRLLLTPLQFLNHLGHQPELLKYLFHLRTD